jgi:hypothetical protein
MSDKYNKQLEEHKPKQHFYMITGKVGKKDTAWVHVDDVPVLKQMRSEIKYLRSFLDSFGGMMKEQLEKNGIRGTKSPINNVYKLLDGMEVILKDEEVHAMQFGALGKYVTAYLDATQIYHGKLPDGFAPDGTWYKNENGVYVRDMDKVAKAVL